MRERIYSRHALYLNTLLRKADVAMYKAKASGDGHHVYGSADDTGFATRLQTVNDLREALTDDQFVVYYQPKIDLAPATSTTWRHWCVGTTPPGVCSTPTDSWT